MECNGYSIIGDDAFNSFTLAWSDALTGESVNTKSGRLS
jgi:hypothetical protein